jgi:hypothetical protein
MTMAGRIAVAAGIAGTVAIVSGIVGVVALTDAGARADDAGSRVSVAKIDVAAPAHPTPAPVTTTDSDIPVPGPVTVPAPEPGEIAPATARNHADTGARSDRRTQDNADAPAQGDGGRSTSQGGAGQGGAGQGGNGQGGSGKSGGARSDAPLQQGAVSGLGDLRAPNALVTPASVDHVSHGHDKALKTQSRKSSPAHRD